MPIRMAMILLGAIMAPPNKNVMVIFVPIIARE